MGGAVAILILMLKGEILKMATSKHAKKMNCRSQSGIFQFQKQNDGEVEESVPQVPVAGKNTETLK